MTKGLTGITDMLNMPSLEEALKDEGIDVHADSESDRHIDEQQINAALEKMQNLTAQMVLLNGADHTDSMDNLYKEILGHARDLMAYGFNVDLTRARGIFEIASSMYGHAMSAVNAKREYQLKAMRLALDKTKVELEEKRTNHMIGSSPPIESGPDNSIIVEDRNKLIAQLREKNKSTDAA